MSGNAYLTEAFKELKMLNEDVFEVSDAGIEQLGDFMTADKVDDTVSIIDPEADTENELEDSYIGKVIIDCCVCHSKIYKNLEDVHETEESGLVNVGEECPFCYSADGFKVIGKVAPFEGEDAADDKGEDNDEGDKGGMDDSAKSEKKSKIDEMLKKKSSKNVEEDLGSWIAAKRLQKMKKTDAPKKPNANASIEDKKKYYDYKSKEKKLTDRANKGAVKGSGDVKPNATQKVLNKISADQKAKSVAKGMETRAKNKSLAARKTLATKLGLKDETELDKLLKDAGYSIKESLDQMNESPYYELTPQHDSRQSFYGKAHVDTGENGDKNRLYSYDTLVAEIIDGKPVVHGTYSATTLRHIKDWLKQNGFRADSAKQIMQDYGDKNESCKTMSEDFKDVTITTGDSHMEMTTDDNGKVTITTEPVTGGGTSDGVIAPIDDADKKEIETAGTNEIDIDVDDFSEDEFNELGESYLKSIYSNVSSYRTTAVESTGNKLKLEGMITFASGKQKKTNFVFESKDITKRGKARFIGENAQICKGKKAFTMTGTLKNNKFISESLNYNYRAKDASTGESTRVYGTVRVHK